MLRLARAPKGVKMTSRDLAPIGAPCWVDLWTSDVEGSRAFYAALFGWEPLELAPEFGGYFMFARGDAPVAGGMGDMGDLPANDTWKIFLNTPDIEQTIAKAVSKGAQQMFPAAPVADMGIQTVLQDPDGAALGLWQAGTFPGFTTLDEHGAPSWFELHARDYRAAVDFYSSVFDLGVQVIADADEFRYATLIGAGGEELAGIMDASAMLADGAGASWLIYWEVDDVDASVVQVSELGGGVIAPPADSPYGRIAEVADTAGARFRLRTKNP
jgi:predicted enzyme related to lactoylglutathione lyase